MIAKTASFAILATAFPLLAAEPTELKPIMAVPDKVVLKVDFNAKDAVLDTKVFTPFSATRWAVEDGVLRGKPSPPEFLKGKPPYHAGINPRLTIKTETTDVIARFDIPFIGGDAVWRLPQVQFGPTANFVWHENGEGSVMINRKGTGLIQLAKYPDFKMEPGRWYQVLAESKGDELVIQFAGGPTFYGKHETFKPKAGKSSLGVSGNPKGTVELANLCIWTVKKETTADWDKKKEKFPALMDVALPRKK